MGYNSNLHPSPTWFSGRIYLKESLDKLEESKVFVKDVIEKSSSIQDIKDKNWFKTKCVEILSKLFLAKLDVVRCLRVVFALSPDDDTKYLNELINNLKEKMVGEGIPEKLCSELFYLLNKKHSVKYSGTGHYGVPNYDFYCNGEIVTSDDEPTIIVKAIKERITTVKKLIELAKKIMFYHYIKYRAKEIEYLYLDDYFYEDEFIIDVLIDNHIISSEEEFFDKFKDIEGDNLHEKFKEIFDKAIDNYVYEIVQFIYDDSFWKWKEEDSIYYAHSW